MKMRITHIVFACLLAGVCVCECSCNKTAARKYSQHERGEHTRDFLTSEMHEKTLVAGPSNMDFVQNVYLPGLQKARGSVDRLERGEVDVVPIAAFVRPFESSIILWMLWLQGEDGPRKVVLRDKDGVFATFDVPQPPAAVDAEQNRSYVWQSGVRLKAPDDFAASKPNEFVSVRVQRRFDLSSLSLSIRKTGDEHEPLAAQMRAVLFPMEAIAQPPATNGSPATQDAGGVRWSTDRSHEN